MNAAERSSPNPQISGVAGAYGRVKRIEDALDKTDSPKLPVQQFLAFIADDHATETQFRQVLIEEADWSVWRPRIEKLRAQLSPLREVIRGTVANIAVLPDLVVSWNKFTVASEGNPAYRVTATSEGLPTIGMGIYYVVSSPKGFRLIATADGLDEVGHRVLALLKKGALPEAQQWLDFTQNNELPEIPRDDKGPAVRYLWAGVAPETRTAVFARAAAASLIGTYAGSSDAILILRETAANPPRYMDPGDL